MADMTALMFRNTMELSSGRKLRRISESSSFISELHMVKDMLIDIIAEISDWLVNMG